VIERLFVYGTLGPNRPNEHVLTEIGGSWQEASILGVLQQKGWGAEMGYPGIVLDEQAQEVNGFVFSSDNFTDNWQKLDAFEGAGYQRVATKAKLIDGSFVEVYIYALSKNID
jgi:gamma-glutamylcyclotransferase (GGCT)/AIG2-like uncharacterized protein YtfP